MIIKSLVKIVKSQTRSICKMALIDTHLLETTSRNLAPPLSLDSHKGSAGRIGIVGGSVEYTGAPYFAGISALKLGADLIHIFCVKEAAPVIKSYSPELIVHPGLNEEYALADIQNWLERLHILVIGPGLGRDKNVFANIELLISICRTFEKPLVIDADGLYLIAQKPDLIKDYPNVILTPNKIEFSRLFTNENEAGFDINREISNRFGEHCYVVKKGKVDQIYSAISKGSCSTKGSPRRCGGQGDLLSGSLAVFYNWALKKGTPNDIDIFSVCYAACKLTRKCNLKAFERLSRSMTTSDMIQEIGCVFQENFEITS